MSGGGAAPGFIGVALLCAGLALLPADARAQQASAERGEYIFHASGCLSCHTDSANKGEPLAGGRAIKTPFGTFRSPNITSDPTHGIGGWSEADFIRALREGRAPDGSHYFPAFPYTSYTKMSDADMRDLHAYLMAQPAVAKSNLPHELGFPFNLRLGVMAWKWFNFTPGPLADESGRDADWTRGRYLVEALGHCAECHTPRNVMGGLVAGKWMAGSADGAEGDAAPNLTPDPATGLGEWSADDIAMALTLGLKPDGDVLGSLMAEVVENGTAKLTEEDLAAMVAYLRALPPIVHQP